MSKKILLLTLITLCVCVSSAWADVFDFTYGYTGVFVSGQFDATYTGPGTYLVTNISGNRVTFPPLVQETITSLIPPSPGNTDNVLYFPPPYVDFLGIAYTTPSLSFVNLYLSGLGPTGCDELVYDINGDYVSDVTLDFFNVSSVLESVPEPSSVLLLVIGLIGLVSTGRRFKR